MTWQPYYQGNGRPTAVSLQKPPPWRDFRAPQVSPTFQPPEGLVDIVNTALHLRRPLLITGAPGSGKSSVVEAVAQELQLGAVLRWHVTSRSTLAEALYRYDVLGRIYAQQLGEHSDTGISRFLQLGPLGTALLPSERPRALLIDEIDKGDLDLAGDLLDVLERGEFEIPELARIETSDPVSVRKWDSTSIRDTAMVTDGRIKCTEFPFIVMTSNGERDFPAPFLRRCIRYTMPKLTDSILKRVVAAHLGAEVSESEDTGDLITKFLSALATGQTLAVDQLLNAVFLITGAEVPVDGQRDRLVASLLRELSHN